MTQPASELPVPPPIAPERMLNPAQWGMASFFAFRSCVLLHADRDLRGVHGQGHVGPTPAQALSLPLVIVTTICLLSSSVVIHFAERSLKRGQRRLFRSAVGGNGGAWNLVSIGYCGRVAHAHCRSPSYDRPQSVWVNLLHACGLPRPACHDWRPRHADRLRLVFWTRADRKKNFATGSNSSPGIGTLSMRFGLSCSWWFMWLAGVAGHDGRITLC